MSLKKLDVIVILFLSIMQVYGQDFNLTKVGSEEDNPAVADFDGDKTIDVIGVNYTFEKPDEFFLYKNTLSTLGEFTKVSILKNFDVKSNLLSYDFDKDGDIDIVVARDATLDLNVLLNDGKGKFTVMALGVSGASDLSYGDTDKDGDIDIFGINILTKKVEHFTNVNNTFTKKTLATGVKGIAVESADIDNNGDTEIIVLSDLLFNNVSILYFDYKANAYMRDSFVFTNTNYVNDIKAHDMNKDGKMDLILSGKYQLEVLIMGATNQVSLKTIKKYSGTSSLGYLSSVAGDFNGDGSIDIVASERNQINYLQNDGTFNFSEVMATGVAPALTLITADLDGDKDLDFIASNGEIWALINNIPQLPNATKELNPQPFYTYPNPAQDLLFISAKYSNHTKYAILDLAGKEIQSGTYDGIGIDVSQLMSGSYFVKMDGGVVGFVKR